MWKGDFIHYLGSPCRGISIFMHDCTFRHSVLKTRVNAKADDKINECDFLKMSGGEGNEGEGKVASIIP